MAVSRTPLPLSEVAVLDRNAESLGVSVRELMGNAGREIAALVASRAPKGPVVFLCGPGNNGGDALVAARHLAPARDVRVVLAGEGPRSLLAREALDALPKGVRRVASEGVEDKVVLDAFHGVTCIVDGLLGAGATGAPRGEIERLLSLQAKTKAFRISIDAPTGAGHRPAFAPDVTVALGAPKAIVGASGETVVVDIGIPERAWTHTGPGEFALYPRAATDQHKGEGGFVLVIGGGPYSGAPALTALAAMRVGADLAITLVPQPVWTSVASFSPNIVARPLEGPDLDLARPSNRVELNRYIGMADALAIGMGLGKMACVKPSVQIAVKRALELKIPIVADAEALWALADIGIDLQDRAVVTPHAKEFEVLTGETPPPPSDVEGRAATAQAAARELHCTVFLKGPTDIIADRERVKRCAGGHPAMSHGGTGDVLAGLIAGLLAKGLSPFDAARLGGTISKKAGEAAAREKSYGLLATDVIQAVPQVLRTYVD